MVHTNFHKKETWVGDGYKRVKASQVEMLKKHYADYNADKDYVLWIVADFYYPFTAVIQGNVVARKSNGEKNRSSTTHSYSIYKQKYSAGIDEKRKKTLVWNPINFS